MPSAARSTMNDEYTKQFEQFENDVAKHAVTVLREDGLYRHLRCSRGGYAYAFDIVTWPGYLCYSGDMGCFVFTRLADMFEFFRGRRTATVDRGYLAEKCVAADKQDGIREFSEEMFKAAIQTDFDAFTEDWKEDDRASLWAEIDAEVVGAVSDGRDAAVRAAMEFVTRGPDGDGRPRHVFTDFWEHRLEDYTTRFWWCCYAVPWAIEHYDAFRESARQPEVDAAIAKASGPADAQTIPIDDAGSSGSNHQS
jgi:hypothetical protein